MKTLLPAGLAACAAATFLVSSPASAAHADATTCHGKAVTIVTGPGTVTGTPGDDVIAVTADGVTVDAGDGDDTICVYGVREIVDAGAGDDDVDTSTAGSGQQYELIKLGPGSDQFTGGSTKDEVDTGAGTAADHDTISTGGGKDTVTVESSQVDVRTGPGHDFILLGDGALGGGMLAMGHDHDNDVIIAERSSGTVDVDLGRQRVSVDSSTYVLKGANVAQVTATTAHLEGDRHFNVLYAHGCQAKLAGGAGNDRLTVLGPDQASPALSCTSGSGRAVGGPGNDNLVAGDGGHFVLIGGPGFDRAEGDGYTGGHTACQVEKKSGCGR